MFVPLTLALALFAAPFQEPAGPLAGLDLRKEQTEVRKLAESLAKAGRGEAAAEVVALFAELGAEEKDVEKLAEKSAETALKARAPRSERAVQRQLEKDLTGIAEAATALAERAATESGDAAEALYRMALRLDGSCVAAREALGHAQDADGVWRSDRERAIHAFRGAFAETLATARAMDFEIDTLGAEDRVLGSTAESPVSAVGYGPVRMEAAMTLGGLQHRMRRVLRASALAHWLVSGELTPNLGEFPMVIVPSGDAWTRYVDGAIAEGWLDAARREETLPVSGSWWIAAGRGGDFASGYVANTAESVVETFWKVDRSLLGGQTERAAWEQLARRASPHAPYGLAAGVANLVGIALLDATWNVMPFERGSPADGSAVDASGEVLADQRHLMTLPVARAWMADQVAAGRALDVGDVLMTPQAEMTTRRLLQLTFIAEYLAARDGLGTALQRYREATGGQPVQNAETMEKATLAVLGQSPQEFMDEWSAWLLSRGAELSLSGRLQGGTGLAIPPGDITYEWLQVINGMRFGAAVDNAVVDLRLSAACREVAAAKAAGEEPQSPEARWVAEHALVGSAEGDPVETVAAWIDNVHQRAALLRRNSAALGIGVVDGVVVVDASSADYRQGLWHAHWPPHMAGNLPAEHAEGGPIAVAGQSNRRLGYPVSLLLGAAHGEPQVTMTLTGPAGEVDCWFTSPLAPLNPEHVPAGYYALIPKAPLVKGKTYKVHASWADSVLDWEFTVR